MFIRKSYFLNLKSFCLILVVFLFFFSQTEAATINTKLTRPPNNIGLAAYWSFDGVDINWNTNKVLDRAGGFDGQMSNMSTSTSPKSGKLGQALRFDPADDQVLLPSNTITNFTSDMSVCAWVNVSDISTDKYIITNSTGVDTEAMGLYITGATLQFTHYTGGVDTGASKASIISANVWTHLCATWSNSTTLLYQDGVQLTSLGASAGQGITENIIGSRNSFADRVMNGLIDDVRIYNRVLSASEVKQLYQNGQTKINTSSALLMSNGLVGYWSFNGVDMNWNTNKALDRSGGGKDGFMFSLSTTTTPAFGKIGQALQFNGSSGGIYITSDVVGTGATTISAWINPSSQNKYIFDTGDNSGTRFYINSANNQLGFTSDGAVTTALSANSSLTFNAWQHVAVVRNSSNQATFYINGVQSGTANQSSGTPTAGQTFNYIGVDFGGGVTFAGLIDEVRVYNRAFSAVEIKQLYNVGR